MRFIKIFIPVLFLVIVLLIVIISRPKHVHYRQEMNKGNIFADNITSYYHKNGVLPSETDVETLKRLTSEKPYRLWWPLYEKQGDSLFTLTYVGGTDSYELYYNSSKSEWTKIYPAEGAELRVIPHHISTSSEIVLLILTNRTRKSFTYGESYLIESEREDKWEPLSSPADNPLPSSLETLVAGNSRIDTLFLNPQQLQYPAGHYRVSKLIHTEAQELWVSADFFIQE